MKTQEQLIAEFEHTHGRTLQLFEDLDDAQLAVPYERGINPPVWELGHSAFFYEYFLLRKFENPEPVMPGFDEIWDSFEIHHRSRWKPGMVPGKGETFAYYHRVLDSVRTIVTSPGLTEEAFYLAQYGIFHQNMHLESLIWARQTLGYPVPQSFVSPQLEGASAPGRSEVEIPGGTYPIGMPHDGSTFSFDNERPGFEKEIEGFTIDSQLVSNEMFLEFVTDPGGYRNPENWSFGGAQWLGDHEDRPVCPRYWREVDGQWMERFFDREVPLDPWRPVLHVTFWEAEAYCNWAGRRLPDEFEWEAAARGTEGSLYPWQGEMDPALVDMDGRALGQRPVNALAGGQTESGCIQMLGTAWEWTTSQYLPYDGFVMDMYPYMSTLQFGDHKTTRGGSCATSSCLIRSTYRQAYFPARSDVFTGFRTVGD